MCIARTKLYLIINYGFYDATKGLARMTYEQFDFFKTVIENLNKNSKDDYMPMIEVYRINEDFIREITDEDDKDEKLYLNGRVYVLKDRYSIKSDDFKKRKVIG